jgi:hypothetical protein
MHKNKFNLRNVVTIVICLVGFTVFSSCDKDDNQALVGKWITSDYHAGDSDSIVFTEDFYVREYFGYIFANQTIPALYSGHYVTYSLSGNTITFTLHYFYPSAGKIEETFKYVLNKNSLTVKGFSNPFSDTKEMRRDVHFTRINKTMPNA